MDSTPLFSHFHNENINNFNKMYTPKPIKMRLPALLDMIESENNYFEKKLGKSDKEEFIPCYNNFNKRCSILIGSLKVMKMIDDSDSSNSNSNSEITSPNKTPSADDIDENISEIYYNMIPSRASNPHIFDGYFERRNTNINEEDEL